MAVQASPLANHAGTRGRCRRAVRFPAHSDHWSEAHIDGGFNQINYWPIVGDVIRVCDESNNVSTSTVEEGLAIWNDAVRSITGRDILVAGCSNVGVRLGDMECGDCGPGSVACGDFPETDSPEELDASFCDQANQKHYVAHELGHNFGFAADNDNCSIMDKCFAQELQPIDVTRFENGYTPDEVDSLSGYSTYSPPYVVSVNLSWNPAPVHSENQFEILNRTGGVYYRATEPKNDNGSTFVESAGGWIWYDVETQTNAKSYPYGEAAWVPVEVGVAAPTDVGFSANPTAGDLRLTWTDDSEKEGWYDVQLLKGGSLYDTRTHAVGSGRGTALSEQWYGVPAGTYTGQVRACAGAPALCSGWVYSGSVYVAPPPSPPPWVSLSGSNGSGTVTWGSVSGATSYRVHVGRDAGGHYTTLYDYVYDSSTPHLLLPCDR